MNREEIQKKYNRLLDQHVKENQEIIKNAKKSGLWKPGLDANRELFIESERKFRKNVDELRNMLNEASE